MNNFFKQIRRKLTYSIVGLWTAFREERSLWSFLLIFPILIAVGFLIQLSYIEWAITSLIMFLLISIEILNTALEAAVDTISYQYNVKVKKIKDIASGATLTISIGASISIFLIYIPKIMEIL